MTSPLYKYTQTAYFDWTTSASCAGSPIILTSVGTGCNSAVQNNVGGSLCTAYNSASEYTMYATTCRQDAMNLTMYARNYVVKSYYVTSETCQGQPLQVFALAADDMCHMNPTGDNNTISYIKTNCNGGQPIWQECSDSKCKNCKSTSYGNAPCQLAGAGTSNNIVCHLANLSNAAGGTTNIAPSNGGNSTGVVGDPTNPFGNGATNLTGVGSLMLAFVVSFVLEKMLCRL